MPKPTPASDPAAVPDATAVPDPTAVPDASAVTAPAEPEYRGPATLHAEDAEVAVEVHLRGNFQPIDGRFHWYGRLTSAAEVDEFAAKHRKNVLVRTAEGEAAATLSDRDTWGRFRIDGTGRPPFQLADETG